MKRSRALWIIVVLVAAVVFIFKYEQGVILGRILHRFFVIDEPSEEPKDKEVMVHSLDSRSFKATEGMRELVRKGKSLSKEDCIAIVEDMYASHARPGEEHRVVPAVCSDSVVGEMRRRAELVTKKADLDDADIAWVANAVAMDGLRDGLESVGWIEKDSLVLAMTKLDAIVKAEEADEKKAAAFFRTIDEAIVTKMSGGGLTVVSRGISPVGVAKLADRARYYSEDGKWTTTEVFDLYSLREEYPAVGPGN